MATKTSVKVAPLADRVVVKALEETEAWLEPSVDRGRCGDGATTGPAVAVSSAPWSGAGRQERGWERRYSGAGP